MPGRPFQSSLEPYLETIRTLRLKRRTWRQVAILSVDTTFDAQNIRQRYQVHLRDDPERSALSATAPAGNSGKERSRP